VVEMEQLMLEHYEETNEHLVRQGSGFDDPTRPDRARQIRIEHWEI